MAKLPKSVLKARAANKHSSDIPLETLLEVKELMDAAARV